MAVCSWLLLLGFLWYDEEVAETAIQYECRPLYSQITHGIQMVDPNVQFQVVVYSLKWCVHLFLFYHCRCLTNSYNVVAHKGGVWKA